MRFAVRQLRISGLSSVIDAKRCSVLILPGGGKGAQSLILATLDTIIVKSAWTISSFAIAVASTKPFVVDFP